MASVELTAEQILDAAQQLPDAERRRLVRALQELPSADRARARARRLRPQFRMPINQRERLSELLAKGNGGRLTVAESAELDRLVEAFEKKTHELALAIGRGKQRRASR